MPYSINGRAFELGADPGPRCNARPVATGLVSCVCDWLRDETGLDFCDRSWICNATLVFWQSASKWLISHVPGSRPWLLSARPAVTFPALEDHCSSLKRPPLPKYTVRWEALCKYLVPCSQDSNALPVNGKSDALPIMHPQSASLQNFM